MNTWKYVSLLINQADMKREQWPNRTEDGSENVHFSSGSKNS